MAGGVVWIGNTTRYREGGARFSQVARTMAASKRRQGHAVRQVVVESKADFRREMAGVAERGETIDELHFVGHSGMYGIMFGTRAWPEQFSRHEWRELSIPFSPDGEAFFHACRTARWFAPFFADAFGVPASGYFWYTALSRSGTKYALVPGWYPKGAPLYVFGCPGMKSHGLLGSARKHVGLARPEALQRFVPRPTGPGGSYDQVADLYDQTFQDIRVRHDEWRWLSAQLDRLPPMPRVLDIGCGNGALLAALADRIASGVGVDASPRMIDHARRACAGQAHLRFDALLGPSLPVADDSVDVVMSLLSFRYLDWDPILDEVHRVLRPGGRFLIVDMVAKPPAVGQMPRVLRDKWRDLQRRRSFPGYLRALRTMVNDAGWRQMLEYNPIRSDHEFRWYLQSRFPGGRFTLLNLGMHARVLAFDSGPVAAPGPGSPRPPAAPSTASSGASA